MNELDQLIDEVLLNYRELYALTEVKLPSRPERNLEGGSDISKASDFLQKFSDYDNKVLKYKRELEIARNKLITNVGKLSRQLEKSGFFKGEIKSSYTSSIDKSSQLIFKTGRLFSDRPKNSNEHFYIQKLDSTPVVYFITDLFFECNLHKDQPKSYNQIINKAIKISKIIQ